MALKHLLGLARVRQAYLLPSYALLYPDLPPGRWITARDVAEEVRRAVLSRGYLWPMPGPRLLADEHFLFRDGDTAVGRALRAWRAKRRARWKRRNNRRSTPPPAERT